MAVRSQRVSCLAVRPVVAADGIHNISADGRLLLPVLPNVGKKAVLKSGFVSAVGMKIAKEVFVVGCGKRIGCVVDQLTHGVIVQKSQLGPALQTLGDPLHIFLAAEPVVTTKGLAAQRAFEVGNRIFIRLGTADHKSGHIPLGFLVEISIRQIFSEDVMTVGLNGVHAPF